MIDHNRIDGSARNLGGKIKEKTGSLMGDTSLQTQGKVDQTTGAAQDTLGSAIDAAVAWRDTVVAFTKDKPVVALFAAVSVGFMLRSLTQTSRR